MLHIFYPNKSESELSTIGVGMISQGLVDSFVLFATEGCK
jgi:hypothetical protein